MIRSIDIGDYHLRFNSETGFMARWGKALDADPEICPVGPEIADIEISTVCNGIGKDMASRKPCTFCYKSNTGCGENMSLDTFKTVLNTLMGNTYDIELEDGRHIVVAADVSVPLVAGGCKLVRELVTTDAIDPAWLDSVPL